MTQEILEGDKIIAEFVDCKIEGDSIKRMSKYYSFPRTMARTIHIDDLEYHSSWDWIMPVWYKFRDLKFNEETASKLHLNYVARLAQGLAYGTIEEFFHNMQIAIKWHNKTKQQ